MIDIDTEQKTRIETAQAVSEEIKSRFKLSVFEMILNCLNHNICVKMLKSEATVDVLSAITESLSINYHSKYIFKSAPIVTKGTAEPEAMTVTLSALAYGSYMDNPMHKKTAIYHFEEAG